jgi:hypothetical protein
MARLIVALALAASVIHASALSMAVDQTMAANPIRKVVTLLQNLQQKVEEEGKQEKELYDKFVCYCKTTSKSLEEAISKATAASRITPEDITAKKAELEAAKADVQKLKADKTSSEDTVKAADSQRAKENEVHVKIIDEGKQTQGAVADAMNVLGGKAPKAAAFLDLRQKSYLPKLLQAIETSNRVSDSNRDAVLAYFRGQADAAGIEDVKAVLKDISDDAAEEMKEENEVEKKSVQNHEKLKMTKAEEIRLALEAMEVKMKKVGELQVEIVNMEHDMKDGAKALEENRKMLAEVQKSCAQKAADWDARTKERAEEQLALADTINLLNSDDALDTFKAAIKKTSFLQLESGFKSTASRQNLRRAEAKLLINTLRTAQPQHRAQLNFLALALSGKAVNFTTIYAKIDEMVSTLNKEQTDDEKKKDYCNDAFVKADASTKDIQRKVDTTSAGVNASQQKVAQLEEEIRAIEEGVTQLDKNVAEAGENRKAEHLEYEGLVKGNNEAIKLLGMAKERLNKFYNPSLTTDTTTTTNPYALSFVQISQHQAPDNSSNSSGVGTPPPTFDSFQKKGEQSNGIIGMLDTLRTDLQKENAIAQAEEQNAQKEYEKTIADAKLKREADLNSAAEKTKAKTGIVTDIQQATQQLKAEQGELVASQKVTFDLHAECDWHLQNFELRKNARSEETESLKNAKAVLAGAKFSFLGVGSITRHLRGS